MSLESKIVIWNLISVPVLFFVIQLILLLAS
jgi:hypothetical protein